MLALGLLPVLAGCSSGGQIADFHSDGCSLFPDRSLISEEDWCDCCFEHDIAYWMGGTKEERLAADIALRECILEKTGNTELAELMYLGVRAGGSPYFYNWYRWGYGWSYERKYQQLTPDERAMAEAKLETYFASNPAHPCVDD
ncbi:hypothetical protein G0Q06_13525 [Puniceicoccales bacterium CK1056]|uniref:Uncharacterized protein n=1 Tax=Oceanipulchritudo coccoides TaxID=2706888 RepID=A0A6B2M776_9BACT|nr:hypothetical protein [Oceanipulchritudo coccoides]